MKNQAKPYLKHFFAKLIIPVIIALVTGCSSMQKMKPSPVVQQPLPPVVNYALSLQGKPYRYGKASPREGFDCSGFIKHVYEHHGIYLPRTTSEMAQSLPRIDNNELHSGDLVFFNTNGNAYSHVGLLVKDDKFVHAPSSRTGKVLVSSLNNLYWRKHYSGARRPGGAWHSSELKLGL